MPPVRLAQLPCASHSCGDPPPYAACRCAAVAKKHKCIVINIIMLGNHRALGQPSLAAMQRRGGGSCMLSTLACKLARAMDTYTHIGNYPAGLNKAWWHTGAAPHGRRTTDERASGHAAAPLDGQRAAPHRRCPMGARRHRHWMVSLHWRWMGSLLDGRLTADAPAPSFRALCRHRASHGIQPQVNPSSRRWHAAAMRPRRIEAVLLHASSRSLQAQAGLPNLCCHPSDRALTPPAAPPAASRPLYARRAPYQIRRRPGGRESLPPGPGDGATGLTKALTTHHLLTALALC